MGWRYTEFLKRKQKLWTFFKFTWRNDCKYNSKSRLEDALKVKVNTNFKSNDYYSEREDEVIENTIVNATLITQASLEEKYAHHFSLEGRIVDIQPERLKNKNGDLKKTGDKLGVVL